MLKCPKCGYIWDYAGRNRYTKCPRCYATVLVSRHRVIVGPTVTLVLRIGNKEVRATCPKAALTADELVEEAMRALERQLGDRCWVTVRAEVSKQ